MAQDILLLLLGLGLAALGGEFFVRGAVGGAHALRVPAGIIGATVAAFATSSPEISVAIHSASKDTPEIALGNAAGANVLNVGLILGIVLLFAPLKADKGFAGRDFPTAFLAPILVAGLGWDGTLSRLDGAILLLAFALWLGVTVTEARRERSAVPKLLGESRWKTALVEGVVGLGMLIAAGELIVRGAGGLGTFLGLDDFVVGATLVAIGTTAPELATTLISRLRGHDDVGIGTVLGSCIFNILVVVGFAAMLNPITVVWSEVSVALATGVLMLLMLIPVRKTVPKWRGVLLLGTYAIYVVGLLTIGRA